MYSTKQECGGENVQVFTDNIYDGQMKDGQRHGYGCMTYCTETKQRIPGDVYTGEWMNDLCHGKGVVQFAGGGSFDGEFKDGMGHGHGVLKMVDGETYDGEFKDGMKHGQGIIKYAKGDIY